MKNSELKSLIDRFINVDSLFTVGRDAEDPDRLILEAIEDDESISDPMKFYKENFGRIWKLTTPYPSQRLDGRTYLVEIEFSDKKIRLEGLYTMDGDEFRISAPIEWRDIRLFNWNK